MKATNPEGKWTEDGAWVAYNHTTLETTSGFATELSCWNWIHHNHPEDANGVTEHVTAQWMPNKINECGE
jgi:hypothetical protein